MISTIFGISFFVSSIRPGIARLPRIGPRTSPRKRSSAVQIPPPATWKKSSAQCELVAIAAIRQPTITATTGSAFTGRISTGRPATTEPASAPGRYCSATAIRTSVYFLRRSSDPEG